MWQTEEIQDNIHLYLEVVSSSWKVTPESWRAASADQSAVGGFCSWQDAAIHNHCTQGKWPIHFRAPYLGLVSIFLNVGGQQSYHKAPNSSEEHKAQTNTLNSNRDCHLKTLLLQIQHTDDSINYLSVQISLRLLLLWHNKHTFSRESCTDWHFSLSDSSCGGFSSSLLLSQNSVFWKEKHSKYWTCWVWRQIHFLWKSLVRSCRPVEMRLVNPRQPGHTADSWATLLFVFGPWCAQRFTVSTRRSAPPLHKQLELPAGASSVEGMDSAGFVRAESGRTERPNKYLTPH